MILDGKQASHASNAKLALAQPQFPPHAGPSERIRKEVPAVHAVMDDSDFWRPKPGVPGMEIPQLIGNRQHPVRQLKGKSPEADSPPGLLGMGVRIQAMFAVYHRAGTNPSPGEYRFDRRPIPRMHNIRLHLSDGACQQSRLKARVVLLGEALDPYPVARQAIRIRSQAPQGAHHMLEPGGIHTVDEVHQAVLQATFAQAVHYMHDADGHRLLPCSPSLHALQARRAGRLAQGAWHERRILAVENFLALLPVQEVPPETPGVGGHASSP